MLDEGEGVSKLLAYGALFVLCYSDQHEAFPKLVYIFFDRQYGDIFLSVLLDRPIGRVQPSAGPNLTN